ncbi:hypothetical protein KDM41_05905 [bacterium]|nr:hypothetical protein [bacterium]
MARGLRLPSGAVLYPFLLALLPAVHFYEANFRIVPFGDLVRPALLGWVVVALVLALGRLAWRDTPTAAAVTAPLLAVIFEGADMGPWVSLLALVAAVVLGVLLRRRPAAWPRLAVRPLDAAVLVLVLLPLVGAGLAARRDTPPETSDLFAADVPMPEAAAVERRPDIYFLLVDGLGQPAFVEENFPVRPSEYSLPLARRGFTVLRHSTANYPQTALSTAATLNLGLLDDLLEIPAPESRDRHALADLIAGSRAVRALQDVGYAVVTYPSGYPLTRLDGADARRRPLLNPTFVEYYLLEDGFLPLLLPLLGRGPADVSFALRRGRLDFIFDDLPQARQGLATDTPAFVFAHILAPHPPFVFDRQGGPAPSRSPFAFADGDHWLNLHGPDDTSYRRRYADQAVWVMHRLAGAIDAITADTTREHVIIVQGDHGPGSGLRWEQPLETDHDERFGIFNAWFVPAGTEVGLYEGMTAVNTFPVLFNALFGTRIALQPDDHWFARMSQPYIFFPVGR